MIFRLLLPSAVSKLDRRRPLRKRDNLHADGRGGTGWGGGAKSYDGEKAWSSINHSIVSALQSQKVSRFCTLKMTGLRKARNILFSCVSGRQGGAICEKRTFSRKLVFHVFVILVTTLFLLLLSRTFTRMPSEFRLFP